MSFEWRTIGLPGGPGIGQARESIDGACELVGVGVGVEGRLSASEEWRMEGGW